MADFKNQKERLALFLEKKKLTKSSFEKMMELSNGYVNSMRKGLGYDKLEQMSNLFPDLNMGWFLTGEGDMFKQSEDLEYLYHFTKLEYLPLILQNGLRFSRFYNANDPKEWMYDNNACREGFDQYGFISLSSENSAYKNAAMWFRYADNHNGVCIALDRSSIEEKIEQSNGSILGKKILYHKIEYKEKELDKKQEDYLNDLLQKDTCWADEQEYRLLYKLDNDTVSEVFIDIKDCVEKIYFGSRLNDEDLYSYIVSNERLLDLYNSGDIFEKVKSFSNGEMHSLSIHSGDLGKKLASYISKLGAKGTKGSFETNNQHSVTLLSHSKVPEVLSSQDIILYDINAAANLKTLLGDKTQNILGKISIPDIPKCDGAVYVKGDSMYPLLKSGDIIAYKEVHNFDSVVKGEMYLISFELDGDEYLTVKYVNHSEKEGCIKLVSYNPHHDPMDIPVSSIYAMALVKVSIRMNTMR